MKEFKKDFHISNLVNGPYQEELEEVGEQVVRDQEEWLDAALKKHLPRDKYDMLKDPNVSDTQKNQYFASNGIRIDHIMGSVGGMRLRIRGKVVEELKINWQTEEGRKIYPVAPTKDDPDPHGDSLWPGKN